MLLLSCGRKHREDASGRVLCPTIMAVGYAVHSKCVVMEVTARGWCLAVGFEYARCNESFEMLNEIGCMLPVHEFG